MSSSCRRQHRDLQQQSIAAIVLPPAVRRSTISIPNCSSFAFLSFEPLALDSSLLFPTYIAQCDLLLQRPTEIINDYIDNYKDYKWRKYHFIHLMCAVIPTRRRNQPRTAPSYLDQCIVLRTDRHIKPRTTTGILPYLVRTRDLGCHTAETFFKAAQYGNLDTLIWLKEEKVEWNWNTCAHAA